MTRVGDFLHRVFGAVGKPDGRAVKIGLNQPAKMGIDAEVLVGVVGVALSTIVGIWQIVLARTRRKGAPTVEMKDDVPTVTIGETERDLITVSLVLVSSGKRLTISVSQDAEALYVADRIAAALGIVRSSMGSQDVFELYNKSKRKTLDPFLSIRDNGVERGDVLTLSRITEFG